MDSSHKGVNASAGLSYTLFTNKFPYDSEQASAIGAILRSAAQRPRLRALACRLGALKCSIAIGSRLVVYYPQPSLYTSRSLR